MENSNVSDNLHILQQTGVLQKFLIVKTLTESEFSKLKADSKRESTSDKEYKEILAKKLESIRGTSEKIPGVIYPTTVEQKRISLSLRAKNISSLLKKDRLTKQDLAFLVASLITQLDLTKEDFQKLHNKSKSDVEQTFSDFEDEDEDSDDDEDDEDDRGF